VVVVGAVEVDRPGTVVNTGAGAETVEVVEEEAALGDPPGEDTAA
jgi:hypothetical protein